MQTTHKKCRMVSFRLSAGEYAEALELCRSRGYSNMSRFGQYALRSFLSVTNASDGPRSETNELRRRIDELAVELKRISESVHIELPCHCAFCGASLPRALPVTPGKANPAGV
jgi:hypothetical protein